MRRRRCQGCRHPECGGARVPSCRREAPLPCCRGCMTMDHISPEQLLGRAVQVGTAAGRAAVRPAASLAYTLAERAIDRTLASGLARHAVSRALEGPLVDSWPKTSFATPSWSA